MHCDRLSVTQSSFRLGRTVKLQVLQNLNVLSKTHFLYVGYSHGRIRCQFCTYFTSFSFLVNHTESVTCILEASKPLNRNGNCQSRESAVVSQCQFTLDGQR